MRAEKGRGSFDEAPGGGSLYDYLACVRRRSNAWLSAGLTAASAQGIRAVGAAEALHCTLHAPWLGCFYSGPLGESLYAKYSYE